MTPSRCISALVALSVISAVGTVSSPVLVHKPLALVLLSPRLPFLLLAGAHITPLVLVPLAVLRLCAGDLFHFELGRRYKDTALAQRFRQHRLANLRPMVVTRAWVQRHELLARHSVLLAILLRPIGRHLMVAGASGTSAKRVAVADLVGTLAYVVTVVVAAGAFT